MVEDSLTKTNGDTELIHTGPKRKERKKRKKNYVTIAIDVETRNDFAIWCDDRGITYDQAIKNLMKK